MSGREAQARPAPAHFSTIARFGVIGQAALLASALLLPLVSEYRFVGDNISELALGRYGAVQTVAFIVAGVSTIGLAHVLRELTRGVWGSRLGSVLLAIYGAGTVLAAVFPTDRIDQASDVWQGSPTGMVHIVAALIGFLSVVAAMFVFSRTFLLAPPWRSLFPWSALLPGAALSLLFVQGEGPWVGLMQRLLVAVIAAWLILAARRAESITAAAAPLPDLHHRHRPAA